MPKLAERLKKLVFVDESHFVSDEMFRSHVWCLPGAMPMAFTKKAWNRKSLSLVLAIGWNGKIHYMIKPHVASSGVKEEEFVLFFLQLHEKVPLDHVFILDNAQVHHSRLLQNVLNGMFADGRTICFTAKYAPELNPIELVFGVMKNQLKAGPQHPRSLVSEVENLTQNIPHLLCSKTIARVFGRKRT